MTVGVGFKCMDAVVLGSDTQITWPGYHKHYENKIFLHGAGGDNNPWSTGFTYAGSPNLAKSFHGKFVAATPLIPPPMTADKLQQAVETVLSLFTFDNDQNSLQMIGGLVAGGEPVLIETSGCVVNRVARVASVGVGDSSVLRFLKPLIADGVFRVRPAVNAAIALVLQAKRYVDQCGGETNVVVLRRNRWYEDVDATRIYNAEQTFLRLEKRIQAVSVALFDRRIGDEEFDSILGRLIEDLKGEHFQAQVPMDD